MTNNAPDYEDNLAFEPAKTAGTIEMAKLSPYAAILITSIILTLR